MARESHDVHRAHTHTHTHTQMARQSDDVDKASHALLYLGKAHLGLKSAAAGIEALSAAIQVPKACPAAPLAPAAIDVGCRSLAVGICCWMPASLHPCTASGTCLLHVVQGGMRGTCGVAVALRGGRPMVGGRALPWSQMRVLTRAHG